MFIDGVDVRDIPLSVLRGAIGFVPQEPFLFSDTIADNVAFGFDAHARLKPSRYSDGDVERPVANDRSATASAERTIADNRSAMDSAERMRRVIDAAGVARLDKDVADFPNGYETMVGERGLTLSGGQKQRTALARAIVIDPRILVLDDALSAVDTYTEEEILSRLRGVMRAADVDHRVASHLDRARRRRDLSCSTAAASPSAARTTSSSERAASTPSCTRNSCSKRNWRRRKSRSKDLRHT